MSITKKMLFIVGVMIALAFLQLYILLFSLKSLVSVRSLIVGESIWTKAQKDAVQNLYQFVNTRDIKNLEEFNRVLSTIEGDKLARIELNKKNINYEYVRIGFLIGQIPSEEINGIIELLVILKNSEHIKNAFISWSKADELIDDLKGISVKIKDLPLKVGAEEKQNILRKISVINSELTEHEKFFSKSLINLSHCLENNIKIYVSFFIFLFGGITIYLLVNLGRYLVNTLIDLTSVATQVGDGNFYIRAPEKFSDELGYLGKSLNLMIANLKVATDSQNITENSLRQSHKKFALMVNALKDYAVYSLDLDGRVQTWNSGAENIKGYKAEEIIGKHFSIFYNSEEKESQSPTSDLNIAKSTSSFDREAIFVKKNGSKFWAQISLNAVYNENEEVIGFTNVTRDITERKLHEIELKKNNIDLEKKIEFRTMELLWRESQLKQITNALPESVCQIDLNEKFLFVNESFCSLLNYSKDQIIGKSISALLEENCYIFLKKQIFKVLQGQLTNFDLKFNKSEIENIYNITLVPHFNELNTICGFILVAHDIKKYKEIEFELKRAKELADVANETKSAFLANMSHEIRTPLGAILGFSEIIVNNKISKIQKRNIVDAIKRNGELLSNVINDILDLSKVEAGKLEVETVPILFSEIINDIESLLKLKAAEKGIKLTITTDDCIPVSINTDPLRLRQILLNIIGNAIKFTDQGEVSVNITLLNSAEYKTSKLSFCIKDTGTGMTSLQAEKLFSPFSQADASTTRKFGGSGLGLILSKKLAKALGGDVVLNQTEINIGSTFTVTIDTGLSTLMHFKKIELKKESSFSRTKKEEEVFNFSNLKILLVEDSVDNQFIISHFLKSTGVYLKVASNGQEGIELAYRESFDLILLDLQMPVMGGFEALKILKLNHCKCPIVALTAHAMKEDRKQCLSAGFSDHLSKPISRLALLKIVDFWTRSSISPDYDINPEF